MNLNESWGRSLKNSLKFSANFINFWIISFTTLSNDFQIFLDNTLIYQIVWEINQINNILSWYEFHLEYLTLENFKLVKRWDKRVLLILRGIQCQHFKAWLKRNHLVYWRETNLIIWSWTLLTGDHALLLIENIWKGWKYLED